MSVGVLPDNNARRAQQLSLEGVADLIYASDGPVFFRARGRLGSHCLMPGGIERFADAWGREVEGFPVCHAANSQ